MDFEEDIERDRVIILIIWNTNNKVVSNKENGDLRAKN